MKEEVPGEKIFFFISTTPNTSNHFKSRLFDHPQKPVAEITIFFQKDGDEWLDQDMDMHNISSIDVVEVENLPNGWILPTVMSITKKSINKCGRGCNSSKWAI